MKTLFLTFLIFTSLFSADKTRIAVLNLGAKSGIDPAMASTVTDLLTGAFVSLKKFDIVDRENLSKIMKEQSIQQSGCSDQSCAVKLGNILNIQKLVMSSLSKLGSKWIVSINFVDVERSKIELSESVTANDEDDLIEKIKTLAQKVGIQIATLGRVIAVNPDGTYLINIGRDDGVSLGTSVSVLRYGEAIIDKTTGDFLGRKVTELGTGKIVKLDPDGALASVKLEGGSGKATEGDRVTIFAKTATSLTTEKVVPETTVDKPTTSKHIQVLWGASWYPATLLKQEDGKYFIHYDGYSESWDEWVGPERIKF